MRVESRAADKRVEVRDDAGKSKATQKLCVGVTRATFDPCLGQDACALLRTGGNRPFHQRERIVPFYFHGLHDTTRGIESMYDFYGCRLQPLAIDNAREPHPRVGIVRTRGRLDIERHEKLSARDTALRSHYRPGTG